MSEEQENMSLGEMRREFDKQGFWQKKPVTKDVLVSLIWAVGFAYLMIYHSLDDLVTMKSVAGETVRASFLPIVQLLSILIFFISYQSMKTNRILKALLDRHIAKGEV